MFAKRNKKRHKKGRNAHAHRSETNRRRDEKNEMIQKERRAEKDKHVLYVEAQSELIKTRPPYARPAINQANMMALHSAMLKTSKALFDGAFEHSRDNLPGCLARQDKTMLYLESYTVLCTSTLSK